MTALSVWPVTQRVSATQRRGRYVPESKAHPGRMLPALAQRAIETYTAPGDLVVDPMCGIGTTLVEAVHLGRRAFGVELEPRWVALAAKNVLHARAQGATGQALALRGDARKLGHGLLDQARGEAALILTSPPYGSSLHGHVRTAPGEGVRKFNHRYSDNRENLGQLSTLAHGDTIAPKLRAALVEILAGCRQLLSPTGRVVMTTRPYRHRGALIDLPGVVVRLAAEAGLALEARHVALLAGLRDGGLVSRASFFQLSRQRRGTIPRMQLIAHEDVLVFTKVPSRA
jgi:modification methylase